MRRHSSLCPAVLLAVTLAFTAVTSAACTNKKSPTAPSEPEPPVVTAPPSASVTLTGTWTGSASDSSGTGEMTWELTQTDDSISGTFTMLDAASGISGAGSISGTLSGSVLQFTLSVPENGFDDPWGSCTADVSGEANASSSSITGTYGGFNSCSDAIESGELTLGKP